MNRFLGTPIFGRGGFSRKRGFMSKGSIPVQCRVIKDDGNRCWGSQMVNGRYAGLGICYAHIAQALVNYQMQDEPVEFSDLRRKGHLKLVKEA